MTRDKIEAIWFLLLVVTVVIGILLLIFHESEEVKYPDLTENKIPDDSYFVKCGTLSHKVCSREKYKQLYVGNDLKEERYTASTLPEKGEDNVLYFVRTDYSWDYGYTKGPYVWEDGLYVRLIDWDEIDRDEAQRRLKDSLQKARVKHKNLRNWRTSSKGGFYSHRRF